MSCTIKAFGTTGETVHSVVVSMGGKDRDFVRELLEKEKLICVGCRKFIKRSEFYCFSQVVTFNREFTATFVCKDCTKPVQEAITKVLNEGRQETKAASAGSGAQA